MGHQIAIAARTYLALTIITGLVYPLVITAIAQSTMESKASGSLISRDGKLIASSLIAQKFESDRYFKSRPSAVDYNPLPSGGANLAPTSKKLQQIASAQRSKLGNDDAPQDLVFASASGLDPHISPEAATFQIEKVAMARQYTPEQTAKLHQLVNKSIDSRQLGFLGEPTVNVVELNLALDTL